MLIPSLCCLSPQNPWLCFYRKETQAYILDGSYSKLNWSVSSKMRGSPQSSLNPSQADIFLEWPWDRSCKRLMTTYIHKDLVLCSASFSCFCFHVIWIKIFCSYHFSGKSDSKKQFCTTFLRKRDGTESCTGILLCIRASCLLNSTGYYEHQLKEPWKMQ